MMRKLIKCRLKVWRFVKKKNWDVKVKWVHFGNCKFLSW